MKRARRAGLLVLAACLLGAAAMTLVTFAARAASGTGRQWHLDIDEALDAVGVRAGMVVGEAGAGTGYFTLPLATRVGPAGAVCANDIDRRALSTLEERVRQDGLANVQAVIGEVDDPRFPRHDLELVVIVHAFHEFRKPVDWLLNLKKYLRPGATVAIIDRDPARGAGSHFWRRERITAYAEQAGYRLVKSAEVGTDHLILVFAVADSGGGTVLQRGIG
jgi:ubiquinone/menaquinone biosynthesis C-methylase UbiE